MGVTDVIKTSSGSVFNIPIARVNNLKDAIIHLKSIGIEIFSLSEKASKNIYDKDIINGLEGDRKFKAIWIPISYFLTKEYKIYPEEIIDYL